MSSEAGLPHIDTYTVTVVGEGTKVEKTVPADVAIEVIRLIAAVEARHSRRSQMIGGRGPREPDLAGFLEKCSPATNVERLTATAMFLREQGYGYFDRESLRSTMRKARLTPTNISRDITTARLKGWISESATVTGELSLTSVGIEAVRSCFGKPQLS